ncbi:unnamed protein product [Meganyctiphanes norvegica]|uniref:Protein krueppel n=1 Tax=Meganyctiphanes norvegica TaxID=48144 RepID=A0AAV2SXL0_MEGNR
MEEKIKIQSVEMKLKEEIETYEEPIDFTGGNYLIKHEKLAFMEHQITPTDGKTYQYSQYDKAFSQNTSINAHQETHTEEKPYQCSQCDKTFSHKGNLKTHQIKHTGEKPYQCSQCDKTFSHKGNLKTHQIKHTGEI